MTNTKLAQPMSNFVEAALATRPYSWVNSILIGVGAHILITGKLEISALLLLVTFVSLLMWIAGLTVLEFFHKKFEYNEKPSHYALPVPFILLVCISITISPKTIIPLVLFSVGLLLYSIKVIGVLSKISYLFRGLSELSLIWLIMAFHDMLVPSIDMLLYMGAIYFLTNSRNLIGDLRDRELDEYTLPVDYPQLSSFLALGMAVIPLILIPNFWISLPVIITIVLAIHWGKQEAGKTHRIYVLSTSFFILNIILETLSPELLPLSCLIFLSVLLNFTYWKVPRKQDKLNPEEKYGYTND